MIVAGGDAIVDLIGRGNRQYEAFAGGSVLNCALVSSALGSRVLFVSSLSKDSFGDLLIDRLKEYGVEFRGDDRVAENSSLALVTLDTFGKPQYSFYRTNTADRVIPVERIVAQMPEDSSFIFHTGSCALIPNDDRQKWLEIARIAKQHGALISIDPNCRPSMTPDLHEYRQGLEAFFELADLIKLSDEDLEFLYPSESQHSFEYFVDRFEPALCVLTEGEKGMIGRTQEGLIVSQPAILNGPLVDMVGAGDCIHGSLIAEIDRLGITSEEISNISENNLKSIMEFAAKVAGHNCAKAGCSPPRSRRELAMQGGL